MTRAIASLMVVLAAPVWAESITLSHEATIYDAKELALKAPEAVACTDRHLVVGDTGNRRLLLFTLAEARVSNAAEFRIPQLTSPISVAIDSKGNLLALDGKTHRVIKVGATGSFDGFLEPKGLEGADKVVVGAFKLDPKDNVYLLDVAGRRVVTVDAGGGFVTQLPLPKDSVAVTDLAIDVAGNLYAIDAVTGILWIADKGGAGFRTLATGLKDKMNFPTALVAAKGRLFMVDRHGNGVAVFGIDGSYLGRQLSYGPAPGLVNYPGQLCITDTGVAFLADTLNNRVQQFSTGTK